MTHPHRIGTKNFFKNFAQRMGLIVHGSHINGLSEKNSCLGQIGHLGRRMTHPASQLSIRYKYCFKI